MFEYSIRDFFECQNIVEPCWFSAFFTQFCLVFECQNLNSDGCSCGLRVGFRASSFEYSTCDLVTKRVDF